MKEIVFNEKAVDFFNTENKKILDNVAVTIVHKDTLEQKDREIKRLNNTINELEKWIEKNKQWQIFSEKCIVWEDKLTEKINELKGDSSNE